MSGRVEFFSIGEVSAMLGLSTHTIRVWERRYRLVTPRRADSGHRRYTMEEVETLKRVNQTVATRQVSLRLAALEALGESPLAEVSATSRPGLGEPRPTETAGPSTNMWRLIGDLDPRLVAVIDTHGRLVDCNVSLARVAGVVRFRLRGTRFVDLVEPYDRAKAVAIYRGALKQRRGWELNLRTPRVVALYSFDCVPLEEEGLPMIACLGREVS